MKTRNFTILYREPGESFPLAFSTIGYDKDGALEAFRRVHGAKGIWAIIQLPSKPPAKLRLTWVL